MPMTAKSGSESETEYAGARALVSLSSMLLCIDCSFSDRTFSN